MMPTLANPPRAEKPYSNSHQTVGIGTILCASPAPSSCCFSFQHLLASYNPSAASSNGCRQSTTAPATRPQQDPHHAPAAQACTYPLLLSFVCQALLDELCPSALLPLPTVQPQLS